MKTKLLEVRDEGTFIPMLCVDMNPDLASVPITNVSEHDRFAAQHGAQLFLLRRCGYPCDGRPNILITHAGADGGPASNDPFYWGGRTRPVAHTYIIEHWDELKDGDVVDVQFILKESMAPKVSERESAT